jgi:5'-nucleotidase
MRILLTNDDGIRAPGLGAMYRKLSAWARIDVVAPETHQSATGHGITLSTPLLTSRTKVPLDGGGSFTGVAVDGRPADCVKLAISQIVPPPVDLVVSGMNSGANVGINVLYSGTVAAALEAGFLGLPSIAVSLLLDRAIPTDYERASTLALGVIQHLHARGVPPGEVLSINIPALHASQSPKGTRFVRQCTRPWVDSYERRQSPKSGEDYYWNSSIFTLGNTESDTDVAALRDGYITVTPLMHDLTNHERLRHWRAE